MSAPTEVPTVGSNSSAGASKPAGLDQAPVAAVAEMDLDRFVGVFEKFFGYAAGEIDSSARLREDLGFDSLEMIEVVILLDTVADSLVPMELVESISTVADVHQWMTVYAGRRDA